MSGTNALIPLQAGKPIFAPPTVQGTEQAIAGGQQLAEAPIQAMGQVQQLQQNALAMKGQMALRSVFADPANLDPKTGMPTPAGIAKVMAVDPATGMKLTQNMQTLWSQQMNQKIQQFNFSDKVQEGFREANTDAMRTYERAMEVSHDPVQAEAAGQKAYSSWYEGLAQGGTVTPEQLKGIPRSWNKNTAPLTDRYYQDQDATKRLEKQGWQLAEDVAPDGTKTQFRYNPGTNEATTLTGEAYRPAGTIQKSGTPPKPLVPGSQAATRAAVADDVKNDPEFKDKTPGQQALEMETRLKIAQGTMDSPTEQHAMALQIAGYQTPPLSGFAASRPSGQKIMAEVQSINPEYQVPFYNQYNRTMTEFGPGKLGTIVRSMNVGIQHLDSIDQLGQALKNRDTRVINMVGNHIAEQLGVPAPTTFDAAKQIVADEIVKAIVGYSGAVQDRETMQAKLNRANSPEQLLAVTKEFRTLMAGQVRGLKKQYEDSTPDTPQFRTGALSFDNKLMPATKRELGLVEGTTTGGGAAASGSGQPRAQQDVAAPPQQAIDDMKAHSDDPRYRQSFIKHFGQAAFDQVIGGYASPKAEPAKPFAVSEPAARAASAAISPADGGYPVPPEHANDPDGTTYNGGKFVKRGDKIVPKIVPGD